MGLLFKVGARSSPLSKAQVVEVEKALNTSFEKVWIDTTGDRRKEISLKTLGKTDFFTKEIDEALLKGNIDFAIHSAKDLPEPLAKGLSIVAITKGLDPRDTLVLRGGETLKNNARIGTSTKRREEIVKQLCPKATIVDIRGNVGERIDQVLSGRIDALVAPEAALIRLELTHLNRIYLPGETAPMQGKLAIVARAGDKKVSDFFHPIDSRPTLYTGLRAPNDTVLHYPLIKTMPLEGSFNGLEKASHLLFTSRTAVELFLSQRKIPDHLKVVAIGQATAKAIGSRVDITAKEETSEGVVEAVKDLQNPQFFWPHSAKSRRVIPDAFKKMGFKLSECILYDTITLHPKEKVPLDNVSEVVFTSPSTVDAFIEIYGTLPQRIVCLGPTTERRVQDHWGAHHQEALLALRPSALAPPLAAL